MIYKKIVLEGNQKIWFTSDTHYGHKNICKGVTSWDLSAHGGEESVRDFKTLDEMNANLVDNINKYVAEDDYLVHLGDWSFGGAENIWKFRKQIICRNITFIIGNHDHHIAKDVELPNAFWADAPKGGDFIIGDAPSHIYNDGRDDLFRVNAQALFDDVFGYLELVVSSPEGKTTYNLMHFPIAIWNKVHHDRIMLHGHCHSGFQHPGRSLDVGVDQAFKMFGEYRPFSQDDIRRFMENREFKKMDHHDKGVN